MVSVVKVGLGALSRVRNYPYGNERRIRGGDRRS